MSNYCRTNTLRDTVIEGPRTLPSSYTGPRESPPANNVPVSNFDTLSDSELLNYYWYPYVETRDPAPITNSQYYILTYGPFVIEANRITRHATWVQMDIEEVRRLKNVEMESQLTQYNTNEVAINPKVNDYINDEAKWLADEQTKLARLSDWDSVAAFDSTKPVVLVLPNSFIGAKNVRQGVALTAQNQAAVASQLDPIWDQTDIDTYVAGNQLAADDPSDSTPAQDPKYTIRQAVANVSEQFNRIVIWRFDVEGEVDPNLDRSIAMEMRNRQDDRDIIAFIYTGAGSTYLGWKKFEDQGGGVWRWALDKNEGDGSLMVWVDSDIAFILSYGTNPAVEADFFTDQIQFPAGVEEDNILVAWDLQ